MLYCIVKKLQSCIISLLVLKYTQSTTHMRQSHDNNLYEQLTTFWPFNHTMTGSGDVILLLERCFAHITSYQVIVVMSSMHVCRYRSRDTVSSNYTFNATPASRRWMKTGYNPGSMENVKVGNWASSCWLWGSGTGRASGTCKSLNANYYRANGSGVTAGRR